MKAIYALGLTAFWIIIVLLLSAVLATAKTETTIAELPVIKPNLPASAKHEPEPCNASQNPISHVYEAFIMTPDGKIIWIGEIKVRQRC